MEGEGFKRPSIRYLVFPVFVAVVPLSPDKLLAKLVQLIIMLV